jgi:hypothetical protein
VPLRVAVLTFRVVVATQISTDNNPPPKSQTRRKKGLSDSHKAEYWEGAEQMIRSKMSRESATCRTAPLRLLPASATRSRLASCDHVLARDLDDLNAQIHPHHFLEEWYQQDEARPLDFIKAPQSKDHSPLILAQDFHSRPDQNQGQREGHNHHNRDDIQRRE